MYPTIEQVLASTTEPDLHPPIAGTSVSDVLRAADSVGALPESYLNFLRAYGPRHFFKVLNWPNPHNHWWFGVGFEPRVFQTSDGPWFSAGYRFTLGTQFFRLEPHAGGFGPEVYGVRGGGFGVYADSFDEWVAMCVRWAYKKIPKRLWTTRFGLPKVTNPRERERA